MNDEPTPIEELALDAMLDEALAGASPPDLSDPILEQLRAAPIDIGGITRLNYSAATVRDSQSASTRNVAVLITVIATLAATFLVAIWLRSDDPWFDNASPHLAVNDPGSADLESSISSPRAPTPQIDLSDNPIPQAAPPRKPRTGIPLVLDAPGSDQPMPHSGSRESPVSQQPLQAVVLVSQQLDSELRGYWDAIGIEPSRDASAEEIVARLSLALGIKLSADSIDDPQRLQTELAQNDMARAIAARWLQQITERGLARVGQEAADGLIDDLAACFQSQKNFDRTLAGWISGQSASTPAFYEAVSSGPKHASDQSAMMRRLAALTMNVDLRCTRCHDSYIEGNGRQEDFHAFAVFLRRGVTRDRDGRVTIDTSTDSPKPSYYELPDGRQRFVEPGVAPGWMNSNQPIGSVREWSEKLIGSEELACGVVNSLWQLVHGQPLRGRVVDPISAPHNDALDRLEENLVQDLMRSQFDIARTLALIIASPATRRGVPDALLPENLLVAAESELEAAKHAVDAFAAAQPPHTDLPLTDRLDQVSRAIGAKLNTDGSPIVAQLNSSSIDGTRNSQPETSSLATDFPGPSNRLPVQWLASIEDETSRVEHLAYLAGMSEVPERVHQAAKAMQAADDPATALNRVWWMVRP